MFWLAFMTNFAFKVNEGCFSPAYLYRLVGNENRKFAENLLNNILMHSISFQSNFAVFLNRHRASFGKECAKIPTENMEKGLCDCPE